MNKKVKIVITINGLELPIDQCRKFNNQWYKVGDISIEDSGDCYYIEGRYYRIETGTIVFDHELKQYSSKKDNIVRGVIDCREEELIYGYFSVIANKNIEINTPTGTIYGLNDQIFNNTRYYRERLSTGKYYHISKLNANDFNKIVKPTNEYKHSLPYDSKDCLDKFIDNYTKLEVPIENTYIDNYAKDLGNYTFGLEFETTAGLIPTRLLNNSGLIPLRDGSISGIEYVTVPISGAKGLQTIVNDCKILSERTKCDNTCSLHLHIGNIPRTKEFILSFFKVMCFIQDEIFSMFPLYKKYNFGLKNKNYSAPFPAIKLLSEMDSKITEGNINANFDILYKYLSCNVNSFKDFNNDLNNIEFHPADPQGNQKWQIHSRYLIANIIPLIFGNKKTIEFRIHTPTFDANKIISFIYMNTAIIDFTVKNQNFILKNSSFLNNKDLTYIIDSSYKNSLRESVLSYLNYRKEHTFSSNRKGDIMYDESKVYTNTYPIDWTLSNKKKVNSINEIIDELPSYTSAYNKASKMIDNYFQQSQQYNWEILGGKEPSKPIRSARVVKASGISKGIVEQMQDFDSQNFNPYSSQENGGYDTKIVYGTGGENQVKDSEQQEINQIEKINKENQEW